MVPRLESQVTIGALRADMKRSYCLFFICFTLFIASSSFLILYAQKYSDSIPLVRTNKEYDRRTVVRPSAIPNAGNGLFALVKIKEGEVIGELGGRLVSDDDSSHGNHYIASLPECAWKKTHPYRYIDSKAHGGNVSRINFAPSEINGIETNFQNAGIKQICEHPYFVFVATKDIEPGAEIWSSYGPNYEYDSFMTLPEIRGFFCGLLKIDCSQGFTYSH
jgi:SET domain-containing protein